MSFTKYPYMSRPRTPSRLLWLLLLSRFVFYIVYEGGYK